MIIVDSNIFIFGEIENAPENKAAIRKYQESLKNDRIGVNVIIFSEVVHKLQLFFGRVEASSRADRILTSPSVDVLDFSTESMINAAKLARDFQMRINDALIAQQAIETGASILTDNVKDFRKLKMIKIIPLRG